MNNRTENEYNSLEEENEGDLGYSDGSIIAFMLIICLMFAMLFFVVLKAIF